jgi:hypothetical protein
MNNLKRGSRTRCLLTWLAASVMAVALVAWAAPDLAEAHAALTGRADRPPRFDAWLTWLCALATALCAAWGWLVTSVVVLEALTGRPRRTTPPGVPAWARRLVLGVCGVAVLGSAAPAIAASPDREPRERPSVLQGLPLPERAEGRSLTEAVARAIAAVPVARPDPARHLVRPGDSLWSVAEAALLASGSPATAAEVAAYWPRIYALNRAVVGADPDLLRPGQLLRLPDPPITPTPREDLR